MIYKSFATIALNRMDPMHIFIIIAASKPYALKVNSQIPWKFLDLSLYSEHVFGLEQNGSRY